MQEISGNAATVSTLVAIGPMDIKNEIKNIEYCIEEAIRKEVWTELEKAYIDLAKCLLTGGATQNDIEYANGFLTESREDFLAKCQDENRQRIVVVSYAVALASVNICTGECAAAYSRLLSYAFCPELPEVLHATRECLFDTLKEAGGRVSESLKEILTGTGDLPAESEVENKTKRLINEFYLRGITELEKPPGVIAVESERELSNIKMRSEEVPPGTFYIEFLKHFSSYTPIMRTRDRKALGGGYFLALGGYNIVIDPGHHFLDNFFEDSSDDTHKNAHSILDINAVIITHFHDDHYADFPSLLSLFHRCSKDDRKDRKYQVDLFLDSVTRKMFKPILKESKYIRKNVCLKGNRRLRRRFRKPIEVTWGIKLTPLPTYHNVFGKNNTGVGLLLQIERDRKFAILITGDTGWRKELGELYQEIRSKNDLLILVAHVSSVYVNEIPDYASPGASTLHKNHLCIRGLCKAIEASDPDMVFLSEIGEEFRGVEWKPNTPIYALRDLVEGIYGKKHSDEPYCLIGQMDEDGFRYFLP